MSPFALLLYSQKKKQQKKEEAADGHEHEEGERTQGNEAPGSLNQSANSGRKQKQDRRVRPHSWAAPIVKHEASFIMNRTFVNHEANFILNLNVRK
ncbi:unnamed protein product [Sphagnum balticum]